MNVAEFVAAAGLTMKSVRIPERTDGIEMNMGDGGRHFVVTMAIGAGDSRRSFSTQYSVGSGVPTSWATRNMEAAFPLTVRRKARALHERAPRSVAWDDMLAEASERYRPEIVDVLDCLANDARVVHYDSFEEWADEFGLDSDSRSAERTYRASAATAKGIRKMLGAELFAQLLELEPE